MPLLKKGSVLGLSILLKVYEEIAEYSDDRDDFNPVTEVVGKLTDAERVQYYKEFAYFDSLIPTLPPSDNAVEAARPYLIEKFG